MMNERYLAMMANYAIRDHSMVALVTMALGMVMWLPILETSPFTSGKDWQKIEWALLLFFNTAGLLLLNRL